MTVANDSRHISNGFEIPSEGYCDQPYIVRTDDGAWLCVMTTGAGREGERGQHIVTTRSTDRGRTWDPLVDVEPAGGVEASYAVLLKGPDGRIFCFYNHNTDNLREVDAEVSTDWAPDGKCRRVDSLGYFVLKVSEDHGVSWSDRRYTIPVRPFQIDRENVYGGRIRFFWNVGKPFFHDGAAYVSLHKVGGFGRGFFTRSEGVLLRCGNIASQADPARFVWETLPDGDVGLRAPDGGGPIAEEQSYSVLSDGSFFCIYRTVDGHPACSYSRDGGHSWTKPEYARYADGRLIRHPRAANFAWRCANGRYLYWYHNHGGNWYEDRNPVWLCGGVEEETTAGPVIRWSQPEIVLYDDDPYIRMSYPDLVEEDDRYFLTETQKSVARVHTIDESLLAGLWAQFGPQAVARDGCLLELAGDMAPSVDMPTLPHFNRRDETRDDFGLADLRSGFTLELAFTLQHLTGGQRLLDGRTASGMGFCLRTTQRGTVELVLNDGRTETSWASDPELLRLGERHHLGVVVDGGPKIIIFIVDGKLCDGGKFRQFGWGRFSPHLRHANGSETLVISPDGGVAVHLLRIFGRPLRTSEIIGNYRAAARIVSSPKRGE